MISQVFPTLWELLSITWILSPYYITIIKYTKPQIIWHPCTYHFLTWTNPMTHAHQDPTNIIRLHNWYTKTRYHKCVAHQSINQLTTQSNHIPVSRFKNFSLNNKSCPCINHQYRNFVKCSPNTNIKRYSLVESPYIEHDLPPCTQNLVVLRFQAGDNAHTPVWYLLLITMEKQWKYYLE